MDGESLEALLASSAGPDCLKELIPKLGVRLRIYTRIKSEIKTSFVGSSSLVEVNLVSSATHIFLFHLLCSRENISFVFD